MFVWLKLTDVTSGVRPPVSSSVTHLHPAGSLTVADCTGEAGWVKDSPAAVVWLLHWTVLTDSIIIWKSNKTDRMTSKFIIQSVSRNNRVQTSAGASYGSGSQWWRPGMCRWSSTCWYLAVRGVWNHFFVISAESTEDNFTNRGVESSKWALTVHRNLNEGGVFTNVNSTFDGCKESESQRCSRHPKP